MELFNFKIGTFYEFIEDDKWGLGFYVNCSTFDWFKRYNLEKNCEEITLCEGNPYPPAQNAGITNPTGKVYEVKICPYCLGQSFVETKCDKTCFIGILRKRFDDVIVAGSVIKKDCSYVGDVRIIGR